MDTHHEVKTANLAVDGTITVKLKSGKRYTYRITTLKRGNLEGKRVIELLVGPDSTYDAWGFVNEKEDGYYIAVWKKRRTPAFEKHTLLLEGRAEEHVECWLQAGRCIRCGRTLTTPESITAGMGPVCRGAI